MLQFAQRPPTEGIVAKLWDRHMGSWRNARYTELPKDPEKHKALVDHINKWKGASTDTSDLGEASRSEIESLSIERRIAPRKGNWWLIPKHVVDDHRHTG